MRKRGKQIRKIEQKLKLLLNHEEEKRRQGEEAEEGSNDTRGTTSE
jgi:hypothetical protein